MTSGGREREHSGSATGLGYRPDIDGLRAVAVIAVVLFHAGVPGVRGGFVGVDAFFVISGFLITSILLGDIRKNAFSIVRFYERRVRRIFPALFVMLGTCFAVGLWIFFPNDLSTLARVAASTALFGSNVYFWQHSGYFDDATELNPLVHTWSLAVEEQFYVFFPFALYLVARRGKRTMTSFFVIALFSSLVLGVLMIDRYPWAAFYLSPPRGWELLIGALLASGSVPPLSNWTLRNAAAALGLGALVYAIAAFSATTRFPGLAALVPCLGAALVIHAGGGGPTLVGRVLALRPVVFVGLASYSLYLWHWPLLVILKHYLATPKLAPAVAAAAVGLAFVLAVLSLRYVERPFRQRGVFSKRAVFVFGGIATLVVLSLSVLVIGARGFPSRFSPATLMLAEAGSNWQEAPCLNRTAADVRGGRLCTLGAASAHKDFFVWGDSHGSALLPAIGKAASGAGLSGTYAIFGGCPPLVGVSRQRSWYGTDCVAFTEAVIAELSRAGSPPTVLLAARWSMWANGLAYKDEILPPFFLMDDQRQAKSVDDNRAIFARGLERTLDTLGKAGKRVVLVGPVPEVGRDVPKVLAMMQRTGISQALAPTVVEFSQRQAFVLRTLKEQATARRLDLVEPHAALCGRELCETKDASGPLYRDDDHLSDAGALRVSVAFGPIFQKLVALEQRE